MASVGRFSFGVGCDRISDIDQEDHNTKEKKDRNEKENNKTFDVFNNDIQLQKFIKVYSNNNNNFFLYYTFYTNHYKYADL